MLTIISILSNWSDARFIQKPLGDGLSLVGLVNDIKMYILGFYYKRGLVDA